MLSPFWLTLLALPLILHRYYRDDSRNEEMLIVVWTLMMLVLTFAFWMYSFVAIFMRVRSIILEREAETTWVKDLVAEEQR